MSGPVLIVVQRLFQVAVYLAIGFVSRRTRLLDETILPGLSSFVYNLFLPTVIFYSALRGAYLLGWQSIILPVLSFGVTVVSVTASFLYQKWRFGGKTSASVAVAGAFGNTAFLGIPFCAALFGPAGGAQGALADFGNTFATFTLGSQVVASEREGGVRLSGLWRVALNRNTVALFVGLLLGRLPVVVPEWVLAPVAGVAGAALPLAMTVVGATIAGMTVGKGPLAGDWERLALPALLKLGLEPGLAFLAATAAVSGGARAVVVLIAAMPTMATLPVIGRQFGGDEELIAAVVFVTTVLCFLTIPLWMLAV